jgi:two-component system nitrogen regulation sensor histidine kinase NtrY
LRIIFKRLKFKLIFTFLGALLCLFFGVNAYLKHSGNTEAPAQVYEISQLILKREQRLVSLAKEFVNEPCSKFNQGGKIWMDAAKNENISFFRYDSENLLFWSDRSVPVGLEYLRKTSTQHLWKLGNGWYLARRFKSDSCTVVALALIKAEYSYQNAYLNDHFPFAEGLHADAQLSLDSTLGGSPLFDSRRNALAWFIPSTTEEIYSHIKPYESFVFIVGIILVILSFHLLIDFKRKPARSHVLLFFSIFLLRIVIQYTHFPAILYESLLFSPSEYASSDWFPSLGDVFLDALLLVYGALVWRKIRIKKYFISNKMLLWVIPFIAFLFLALNLMLLRSLILDSSIAFGVNNITAFSFTSFLAYLIAGMVLIAFVLLTNKLFSEFQPQRKHIWVFIGATAIFTSVAFLLFNDGIYIPFLFASVLSTFISLTYTRWERMTILYTVSALALLSFTATFFIVNYTAQRENNRRLLLAERYADERDLIGESIFADTEKRIFTDTLLKNYLRPGDTISGQVRDFTQLYFNGYWERYTITPHILGADDCLLNTVYAANSNHKPEEYDRKIDSIGIPTQSENFFFLENNNGRISYIARLIIRELAPDTSVLARLYLEFDSRFTPEEIGYPELLLDKRVQSHTDLSRYSYARYYKGKLVTNCGSFPYSLGDAMFADNKAEGARFLKKDGFSHLGYRSGSDTLVILSLPQPSWIQVLTPFSYMMVLLTVLGGTIVLFRLRRENFKLSFKRKIQLAIISILFISLLLIGGGSIAFINSNNNQKNIQNLSEKIHSILIETENLLGKDAFLDPSRVEDYSSKLSKMSKVFTADINIYGPSGLLFASSRAKLFDEGLISQKISPEAFQQLQVNQSSECVQKERIGTLEYLSAYVPLRNTENKVIGYINLPYFARQSEIQREVATFVVAMVNIYIILLVLVLIAAIVLSNSVTEPLLIIQEGLGKLTLGKQNAPIRWKGKDEIGALVAEYNRMIDELEHSAEKLARSERESAWREMAKQVAHEIKNPLTPMKLSTQMLQRAWKDRSDGFEDRLDRYTQNLIEQIDTLSHIATEFGNFAQMPHMRKERIDLVELIIHAAEFHRGSIPIEVNIEGIGSDHCYVQSDKEQLIRVFNNLIRNAQQALEAAEMPHITLSLQRNSDCYTVSVSDNGLGIPEALKDKIFRPNFTTKSTGMGLGLALVKNIIESSGGSIAFESESGKGTHFIFSLPSLKNT